MIAPGIFRRLLVGLLLATLLPLILLQQSLTERFTTEMRTRISGNLAAIADHKVEQIESILQRQLETANLLAAAPSTLGLLREAEASGRNGAAYASPHFHEQIRSFKDGVGRVLEQSGCYNLLLIGADGEVLVSYRQDADQGTNLFTGPYRGSALAKTARQTMLVLDNNVSDFEWSEPFNAHAAFITAPVMEGSQVLGVIALQIAADDVRQNLVDVQGLGTSGSAMLAQFSGDPPRIVTSVPGENAQAIFSDRLPQLALGQSLPLARALDGEHGQGEMLDYRQVPVLAAWRYLPMTRWGLVVKMDASEAFAPIHELRTQGLVLLVLALLLAVLIAFWQGRGIVRPVQRLTQAASRIAAGNLHQRVRVTGRDEVAQLAKTFNTMIDSLAYAQQAVHEAHDGLEHKVAQRTEALEWEKERMHTILDNVLNGIVSFNEGGIIESFNQSAERIFAYTADEALGMPIQQLIPEAFNGGSTSFAAGLRAHIGVEREVMGHRKDGSAFPLRVSLSETHQGSRQMLIASVQDVSEIRRAESTLRLYASVFEHSGEPMLISDGDNRVLAVNPAFTTLTGYPSEEVIGEDSYMLIADKTSRQTIQDTRDALMNQGFWQGETWNRTREGRVYPCFMSISAVRDDAGAARHYIVSYQDISERKAAEERITHLAHHDTLTGLLNRLSLSNRLEQALATTRREEQRLAVLFIDMDRFKIVNDTLGHSAGDKLLVEVARRIGEIVRHSDIVARLGGDEFVVVLTDVEGAPAVARVAEKIIQLLGKPYIIGTNEVHSTPSIGVAIFPNDGADSATLMKNADTAMYHAKGKGRNNYQFFAPEMNLLAVERLRLERHMAVAVAQNQFELLYQPRLDGGTGSFVSVEALLRWRHPDDGLLTPESFIDVAEETGLILPLGEWVIDEACRQLRAWRDEGLHGIGMTVNLSARQLYSPTLSPFMARTLIKHGLTGADLQFDIAESILMADPETSIGRLRELSRLGVRLSIDAFGTSSSSLSHLHEMPIDSLNIDRSLVRDIETADDKVTLCNATIALAHNLGLRVTAEGVETEAQRDFLLRNRCDFMQGFLFGMPSPAADVPAMVRARLH